MFSVESLTFTSLSTQSQVREAAMSAVAALVSVSTDLPCAYLHQSLQTLLSGFQSCTLLYSTIACILYFALVFKEDHVTNVELREFGEQ